MKLEDFCMLVGSSVIAAVMLYFLNSAFDKACSNTDKETCERMNRWMAD